MHQQSTTQSTNPQAISNGQQTLSSPLCMIAQDLQKLKQKYKNFKQKNARKYKSVHPIILRHFYDHKSEFADIPEFILIICSKQMQIKYVVATLISLIKKKWKVPQSQDIYVCNSKGKHLLGCNEGNIGDLLKQLKNQEEFIQWKYTFSSQIIQGDIDGLIYVIPLIIIAAVPVLIYMGAQKAVSWTYNKLPTLIKVSAASKFKQQFSFQQRFQRSKQALSDNPFMLPLIIEKHQLSTLPSLPNKILVQPFFTFQKFRYMITNKITSKQQANFSIYFYLSGRLPNQDSTIKETYQKYKDKDGFLYVTYQEQESF